MKYLKPIILNGYFESIDRYNRGHFIYSSELIPKGFVDEYKDITKEKIKNIDDKMREYHTKLDIEYDFKDWKCPLENNTFSVKLTKIDKDIKEMFGMPVKITAKIIPFNFIKKNKKIRGWGLTAITIKQIKI